MEILGLYSKQGSAYLTIPRTSVFNLYCSTIQYSSTWQMYCYLLPLAVIECCTEYKYSGTSNSHVHALFQLPGTRTCMLLSFGLDYHRVIGHGHRLRQALSESFVFPIQITPQTTDYESVRVLVRVVCLIPVSCDSQLGTKVFYVIRCIE